MVDGAGPQVAVVIGQPVEHSLSPAIHNAAFAALGLDWHYFAMSVPDGDASAALKAMRTLGLAGMSVTMPHKSAIAGAVDTCTPIAEALGAVNCVFWRGDELVGDNTDGAGFVDSLLQTEGFDALGQRVVVLGAGGAARAVVWALANAGAADIAVINRSHERGVAAAALAGDRGRVGSPDAVAEADVVVNATSVGMVGGNMPLNPALLVPGQLVVDLIYEPAVSPLLAATRERGIAATNGLGMLIHQAAHAFKRWTGQDPPIDVMAAAARTGLEVREHRRR